VDENVTGCRDMGYRWPKPPSVSHDSSRLPFKYAVDAARIYEIKDLSVRLLAPSNNWIDCPGELYLQSDGLLRLDLTILSVHEFKPKAPLFGCFDVFHNVGVPAKNSDGQGLRIIIRRLEGYKLNLSPGKECAFCTYEVNLASAGFDSAISAKGKLLVPLLNFHTHLGESVRYSDGSEALTTMQFTADNRSCRLYIDRDHIQGASVSESFCVGHLEYEVLNFDEKRERSFVNKITLLLSIATGRWIEAGMLIMEGSNDCVLMSSRPGSGKTDYFPIGGVGRADDLRLFIEQCYKHVPDGENLPIRAIVRYLCFLLSLDVWEIEILVASALLESLKFYYAAVLAILDGKVKSVSEFEVKLVTHRLPQPPFKLLYEDCHLWVKPPKRKKEGNKRTMQIENAKLFPSLAKSLGVSTDTLKLKLFYQVYRNPIVHSGRTPRFDDKEHRIVEYSIDFAMRVILRWIGYRGKYNQYGTWVEEEC
jgi:hypothetical protein